MILESCWLLAKRIRVQETIQLPRLIAVEWMVHDPAAPIALYSAYRSGDHSNVMVRVRRIAQCPCPTVRAVEISSAAIAVLFVRSVLEEQARCGLCRPYWTTYMVHP